MVHSLHLFVCHDGGLEGVESGRQGRYYLGVYLQKMVNRGRDDVMVWCFQSARRTVREVMRGTESGVQFFFDFLPEPSPPWAVALAPPAGHPSPTFIYLLFEIGSINSVTRSALLAAFLC